MQKNNKYYVFWGSAILFFTVAMASSVVGLQYWFLNQEPLCPLPQATTITVEEIPITLEVHEPDRSLTQPHKWVDQENQVIHYIYADGSGTMIPMYATVPPIWYENLLDAYIKIHEETMPQEIIESIPWEWRQAVMPQPKLLPEGSSGH